MGGGGRGFLAPAVGWRGVGGFEEGLFVAGEAKDALL